MNIKATLTIYHSRRDIYGNVYYAVRLSLGEGQSIVGTIGADNISTLECREKLNWYIERHELPIREYNRMTKGWQYLGCRWEDIRDRLQALQREKR